MEIPADSNDVCELCKVFECPSCKQMTARVIVVNDKYKVVCYRKGCKFEIEIPEELYGKYFPTKKKEGDRST